MQRAVRVCHLNHAFGACSSCWLVLVEWQARTYAEGEGRCSQSSRLWGPGKLLHMYIRIWVSCPCNTQTLAVSSCFGIRINDK